MAPDLALALTPTPAAQDVVEYVETVFYSRRSAAAEDGLFSDFEQDDGGGSLEKVEPALDADTGKVFPAPIPISGVGSDQNETEGKDAKVGDTKTEVKVTFHHPKNDMHPKTRNILYRLRLRKVFSGLFVKATEGVTEMLQKVEPYVTYGYGGNFSFFQVPLFLFLGTIFSIE
ncbi:ERF114 protein [Hibiscus syriacus]|uniref:ERF114 protein n=1 Tax=Hibiscus syriacus TaxID=106335 RepID=A0A6A2XTB6_HIBSY|nr:ERF114 protein [Hibiscus syriacus]